VKVHEKSIIIEQWQIGTENTQRGNGAIGRLEGDIRPSSSIGTNPSVTIAHSK